MIIIFVELKKSSSRSCSGALLLAVNTVTSRAGASSAFRVYYSPQTAAKSLLFNERLKCVCLSGRMLEATRWLLGAGILMWMLAWLGESAIGVNWGTVSFHKLKPSTVVGLLKDNKIPKVKVFEAEADVLKALMGSGIQVMLGIPNEMLPLLSTSPAAADSWLRQNVSAYLGKGGADIRFLSSLLYSIFH